MATYEVGDHVKLLPSGQMAVISEVRVGAKYVAYGFDHMGFRMWVSGASIAAPTTQPTPAADGDAFVPGVFVTVNGEELSLAEYDKRFKIEVADVQCRCGYMASQHWTDGECPGDGYTGQGSPTMDEVLRQLKAENADLREQARLVEGMATQIVHAQMVLQDALGYKENDYNVSLTDLALDIERLRDALTFTKAELAKIPAPITDTRYATEVINGVWAVVADALDAATADADDGNGGA